MDATIKESTPATGQFLISLDAQHIWFRVMFYKLNARIRVSAMKQLQRYLMEYKTRA